MSEQIPPPSYEDPYRKRRAQAAENESRDLQFMPKGLTAERLQALREFLKHAKTDEIAAIRKLYGDMPEVLQMIGLELVETHPDED